MEPEAGDEVLSHRHIYASKALQPLLANDSFVTDEEQYWVRKQKLRSFTYIRSYMLRGLQILLLLTLSSCASQASFMKEGMSKKDFFDSFSVWYLNMEKIYYDPVSKIEIFAPNPLYWTSENSGLVTIFDNVSLEYAPLYTYCSQLPKGACQQKGNGQVRSWYNEEKIATLAIEGDEDAKLLLSVLTLRQEKFEKDIDKIMTDGIEWGRYEPPFTNVYYKVQRKQKFDPDKEDIDKKTAIEIYKKYKKYEAREEQEELSTNMFRAFTQSSKHYCGEDSKGGYYCSHKDDQKQVFVNPSRTKSSRNTEHNTSLSSNNFFSDLIDHALDLYVQKALGIKSPSYGPSKDDLREIEEASRRGMRKALRKQKRMDNIYKNIKTPPPIR